MSTLIYSVKIYVFHSQFQLITHEHFLYSFNRIKSNARPTTDYRPTAILAYSYIGLQLYWLGLGSHTGEPMVLEAVVRSPTNMAAAKIVAVDFIDFIKYSRLTSTK